MPVELRAPVMGVPLAAVVIVAATAWAADVDTQERAVNGGAEQELANWTAGGAFGVGSYGTGADVPTTDEAQREGFGSRMFRGFERNASLTQMVSFADRAELIDEGAQHFSARASLGAAGRRLDGMQLVAQPLDAAGTPLGDAITLGPPTADDRQGAATLVDCQAQSGLRVGVRSVRVTLTATGASVDNTAMADNITIATDLSGADDHMVTRSAQGPNCYVHFSTPTPTATPTATPTPPAPAATRLSLARRRLTFDAPAVELSITISRGGRVRRAFLQHPATPRRLRVAFPRLAPGRYRVDVRAEGYATVRAVRRLNR